MKKVLFVLCVAAGLIACQSPDKKPSVTLSADDKHNAANDTANFTTIQWLDSTDITLGTVKEGQIVEVAYRFKNSGNKNLVIEDVAAGCGCTVPEKPEKAIPPGGEDVIRAKFDSKGRVGRNDKNITVTANTTPSKQQILQFHVEVSSK